MKTIKLITVLLFVSVFLTPETTFAQPPKWAPVHGYRAKTRYIYFPEHNFYYDLQRRSYFYLNNGSWTISVSIPGPFININLGRATQVQLDYYGTYPYYYNTEHCTKYKVVKVKKSKPRVIVIDNDHDHHHYEKVKIKNNGHGHGHGNGHGNGHGHGNGKGKH